MNRSLIAALLCSASLSALAAPVVLSGTVRDFHADGVNFEGGISGVVGGAVSSTLSGQSPTLTATGASFISNSGAGAFDNWYTRPTDSVTYNITLDESSPGSGVYTYNNNNFFPINGQLFGDEGYGQNFHFTYAIHASFGYTRGSGQTFTFGGDDDVWVYFDKLLGIDLGGVHGFASSTVNLDDLFNAAGGRDSGNYGFDFFFAERHTSGSNLTISTSLLLRDNPGQAVPEPGSLALAGLALVAGLRTRRRRA